MEEKTKKKIAYACQSCGMPMTKKEEQAINLDKTINKDYCKNCLIDEKFVDEGITMQEKIDFLVNRAVNEYKMDETRARSVAKNLLPVLKRWKK